jgi:integrase
VEPARVLKVDPIARLKVRRPDVVREDLIDPFTPAELDAIAAQLAPPIGNMVRFWAWTGLRQGELFGLTWADVDLERGVIRVTKALRDGRRKAPKTRQGTREIRLLQPAVEALKAQREHSQLVQREVFLNPERQEPWHADKPVRKLWAAACTAAKVRYRFPRQLRHTFASWMLSAGENPLWVSRVMGHTDPSLTLRVYSRFIPDVFPDAGARAIAAAAAANPKAR